MVISQYAIVLVTLDSTVGSEIRKTRPCVVLSPNEMNRQVNTVVVAPMTTSSKAYPSRVEVQSSNKVGWVVLDQIRTIDKSRIIKVLGQLTVTEATTIKDVIKRLFVD